MFMKPEIENGRFAHYTYGEVVPLEYSLEGQEELEEVCEGFYCRLSAPGYLDATEWSGPYDTRDEALSALVDMYAETDKEEQEMREYAAS